MECRQSVPSRLFRHGGVAALTAILETLIYLALRTRLPAPAAAVPALLLAMLWIVVASPLLSASSASRLITGGACVHGSLVLLCVLAAGGNVAWLSVLKLYLLWAALACGEMGFCALATSPARRMSLAMLSVVAVLVLSASPFWANGIIDLPAPVRSPLVAAVRVTNPVFAVAAAIEPASFIWQESPILYPRTVLGRDTPMPAVGWEKSLVLFGLLAVVFWALAFMRRGAAAAVRPCGAPPGRGG